MPVETELKLLINPQDIPRLRRHPLFKRARRRMSRKLYSEYYDTRDLALWRGGIALRLRRDGTRWIQTVKSNDHAVAGLHQRQEIETQVTGPSPDFDAIHDLALARLFSSRKLRKRLKPVMTTEFTRSSSVLQPGRGVAIEASFDRGQIRSSDASAPICELELEVKRGEARHAYEAAIQLLAAAPLIVANRSKAERGFSLYCDTPLAPCKVDPSLLTAQMSSGAAFKALVASCLAHFLANQHGLLNSRDPEYLHQMRVAMRRLRSAFTIFAPLLSKHTLTPFANDTRWLIAALGKARDWDVFDTEVLPSIAKRYADRHGLNDIQRAVTRLRGSARRSARRTVVSKRSQGLILKLGLWLSTEESPSNADAAQRMALALPIEQFARAALSDAQARVLKCGRHFGRLTPHRLHRLRIAAKSLRYAIDFFAPLYDQQHVKHFRAALISLQNALGVFNDAVTMTHLAERACHNLKTASAKEARDIILGWSGGRQHSGIEFMKPMWQKVRATRPFWEVA